MAIVGSIRHNGRQLPCGSHSDITSVDRLADRDRAETYEITVGSSEMRDLTGTKFEVSQEQVGR